jgi:hypothetical protein
MDEKSFRIRQIMTQTTYTEEEASRKLEEFENDPIKVIRHFMGLPDKTNTRKKTINQEIFRQYRLKLDSSMKGYLDSHPIDLNQVIENFKESDERLKKANKKQSSC